MQQLRWYNDSSEVVAFAHWMADTTAMSPSDVIRIFEKPWTYESDHAEYVHATSQIQTTSLTTREAIMELVDLFKLAAVGADKLDHTEAYIEMIADLHREITALIRGGAIVTVFQGLARDWRDRALDCDDELARIFVSWADTVEHRL